MQRINTFLILCLPIVAFSSFCFGKEELDMKWPTHYLEGKWYSCNESRIDQNGRIVYEKFGRSLERWSRYDNSGNRVHLKFGVSRVFFEYSTILAVLPKLDYKLDRNGNKKKYAEEHWGKESWSVYDNKGIEIYFWDNEGYENGASREQQKTQCIARIPKTMNTGVSTIQKGKNCITGTAREKKVGMNMILKDIWCLKKIRVMVKLYTSMIPKEI